MMPTDSVTTRSLSLSPRATIALLTLQLRTSLQDAAAAEAEGAEIDHEVALAQLREHLAPRVEERRRSLDETLAQARAEAAAAVGAARAEAAAIIAAATTASPAVHPSPAGVEQSRLARSLPPPSIESPARPELARLKLQLCESLEEAAGAEAEATALDRDEPHAQFWARLRPLIEERRRLLGVELAEAQAEAAEAVVAARYEASTIVAEATPSHAQLPAVLPPPNTVVVDPNALAQIVAVVLATLLDERLAVWRDARPAVSASNASPERRSFLAHARLLDVFLMGLAMAIVLVILAAWLA